MNATMYREAGARCGVYFNPKCLHSALTTQSSVDSSSLVQKAGQAQEQGHKCMLENWLSLGSDSGEIEVATAAKCCVELLNMLAKI